jgi:putative ATP-binding cassette transporter
MGLVAGLSNAGLIATIGKIVQDMPHGAHLPALASLFVVLSVGTFLAKSLSEILLVKITQDVIYELRVSLSINLLKVPLELLEEIGKPGLLAILTNDVESFSESARLLPRIVGDIVVVVASLCYIGTLSPYVLLFFVVCTTIGIAAFLFFERVPRAGLVDVRKRVDDIYCSLRGLTDGCRELKLNTRRRNIFLDHVLIPSAITLRDSLMKTMSTYAFINNTGEALFYLVIGMTFLAVVYVIPVSPASLTGIAFLMLFLAQPLSGLLGCAPRLRSASISLQRIFSLQDSFRSDVVVGARAPRAMFTAPVKTLELSGIFYRPARRHGTEFELGPIDLKINVGEIVFLTGGNGSGKSTLGLVILGLYRPQSGVIRMNGIEIDENNIDEYRQQFSAVFPDGYTFERVLSPDELHLSGRVESYLTKMKLDNKTFVADGKFSNVDLSTGQRKRIALIAAFLDDADVYVFDEWAADQDPEFRSLFYRSLLPELKARGKIVVAITHDDSYFSYADRIINLDSGKITCTA